MPADDGRGLDQGQSLRLAVPEVKALENGSFSDLRLLLSEVQGALNDALASCSNVSLPLHALARTAAALPLGTDLGPAQLSLLALIESVHP